MVAINYNENNHIYRGTQRVNPMMLCLAFKAEVPVSDTNMASRLGWLFLAANVFLLLVQILAG